MEKILLNPFIWGILLLLLSYVISIWPWKHCPHCRSLQLCFFKGDPACSHAELIYCKRCNHTHKRVITMGPVFERRNRKWQPHILTEDEKDFLAI